MGYAGHRAEALQHLRAYLMIGATFLLVLAILIVDGELARHRRTRLPAELRRHDRDGRGA